MTSTVVNRSSVSHCSRERVDPAVGDGGPDLARGEVVEHDEATALDQVGDGVDAHLGRLAGVQEQQRVGTLVEQRRPVRGQDLDERVVGEDLAAAGRSLPKSSAAVTIRAFSPRTPERSQAVPTPQPVPNSAIVPSRVAASIASSRPVSLRQNDTYPALRETSNARLTMSGRSSGG